MVAYIVLIGWASLAKNPFPRWLIIFTQAYIAAAIVQMIGWRVAKLGMYLIVYTLFLTELVLNWLFAMSISPIVLTLLAETTGQESAEFLGMLPDKPLFWPMVGCAVAVIALNILMECKRKCINHWLGSQAKVTRILRYVAAAMLIGGTVFGTVSYVSLFNCDEMNEVDEWRSHMRNPDDAITKLLVGSYDVYLSGKEMDKVTELLDSMAITAPTDKADSVSVVLVIGESFIREHSPLYGYLLNTTPFLKSEQEAGRLFVFSDAVTPYNQTTNVIRNLLSCNSIGNGEHWSAAPPLTAVFKKNGFWVSMQDNQKSQSLLDLFGFSLNAYLYHPKVVQHSYNEVNEVSLPFDGQLVDNYQQHTKGNDKARQLVLFHLMGQHVNYEERFPADDSHFKVYSADSLTFRREPWLTRDMRQTIANYDNATRYNDYVLQRIITHFEKQNAVVIYLSDHGEEVYDYRPSYGRDDYKLGDDPKHALRYQYVVPFMVWCSEKYKEKNIETVVQLEQATEKPLMIDNTCHLLFHLAGLQTNYYISSRDVLSDDYRCPTRFINNSVNYDDIMHAQ
jgi:heptose-I-phosphate ethanolaminephosphotransferase